MIAKMIESFVIKKSDKQILFLIYIDINSLPHPTEGGKVHFTAPE